MHALKRKKIDALRCGAQVMGEQGDGQESARELPVPGAQPNVAARGRGGAGSRRIQSHLHRSSAPEDDITLREVPWEDALTRLSRIDATR